MIEDREHLVIVATEGPADNYPRRVASPEATKNTATRTAPVKKPKKSMAKRRPRLGPGAATTISAGIASATGDGGDHAGTSGGGDTGGAGENAGGGGSTGASVSGWGGSGVHDWGGATGGDDDDAGRATGSDGSIGGGGPRSSLERLALIADTASSMAVCTVA